MVWCFWQVWLLLAAFHGCCSTPVVAFDGPDGIPAHIVDQMALIKNEISNDVLAHLSWTSDRAIIAALCKHRRKHFLDAFCGTGRMAVSLQSLGFVGHTFDLACSDYQDILSVHGQAMLLTMLLDIMSGGLAWFGIVCSTWVFMAMGHTHRSASQPWGDRGREDVVNGNIMAKYVGVLIELCSLRNVFWLIEQPSSSLILFYKPIRRRVRSVKSRVLGAGVERKFVWLGYFGHRMFKPTVLVGIAPWLRFLVSKKQRTAKIPLHWTRGTVREAGPRAGSFRVHGCKTNAANLKKTQVYPWRFCAEFARLYNNWYDDKYHTQA